MSVCFIPAQAQFFKKLKAKVDQSANEVKLKVKDKAETAPDRVIDHTANKVQTKAESKIDSKENKANTKVDKTVDKVDSIKIKKSKTEEVKDSIQNKTALSFPGKEIIKMQVNKNTNVLPYNFNDKAILYLYKHGNSFI
jgi:hypothetical protein